MGSPVLPATGADPNFPTIPGGVVRVKNILLRESDIPSEHTSGNLRGTVVLPAYATLDDIKCVLLQDFSSAFSGWIEVGHSYPSYAADGVVNGGNGNTDTEFFYYGNGGYASTVSSGFWGSTMNNDAFGGVNFANATLRAYNDTTDAYGFDSNYYTYGQQVPVERSIVVRLSCGATDPDYSLRVGCLSVSIQYSIPSFEYATFSAA